MYEVEEYDGFEVTAVYQNEDGSQYVQVDEVTLIWVSEDGKESFLVGE